MSLLLSASLPSTVYLGTSIATCDKSKVEFNKESQPTPDYNASAQPYNSLCLITITEAEDVTGMLHSVLVF